ncbi:hypothetical protein B0A48_01022 [Cryoendolithus antarcticus]|uniref:Uncharacterized protein n=1 Tax=Cryoendolithus antarcticus TaxID=1507870 RepID=A0A1V8TS24_9PEZI|nr:hypothetical protein B0A48_01022 [Cryoendolithus antarcticus]
MAVSFPWPTREMSGAEVLPIRSMKPQEKQKWLQSVWTKLQAEAGSRSKSSIRPPLIANGTDKPVSASRFEAPRNPSPRPPSSVGLGRSNATQSVRITNRNLELPTRGRNTDGTDGARGRSPSPSGEMSLGRMLTMTRRPPKNMMGDALSLALFRVQEAA